MTFYQKIKALLKPAKPAEYRTTDGDKLAPYPGMSDSDLRDYETAFNVPSSFDSPQKRI